VITGPSDLNLFDLLIGQQKKHVLPSLKNESKLPNDRFL
jgi:hypothetical protein